MSAEEKAVRDIVAKKIRELRSELKALPSALAQLEHQVLAAFEQGT